MYLLRRAECEITAQQKLYGVQKDFCFLYDYHHHILARKPMQYVTYDDALFFPVPAQDPNLEPFPPRRIPPQRNPKASKISFILVGGFSLSILLPALDIKYYCSPLSPWIV